MAQKRAFMKQVNGVTFAGRTDSNHWVVTDGPVEFGGSDAGIRPKELLLLSLGGCTGADVASILQKKRVEFDGYEMNLTADTTDEYPQVFTKIHIEYIFYGSNIKEKDIDRAIELSQTKYCGVTAMLKKAMEITYSYKIINNKESN